MRLSAVSHSFKTHFSRVFSKVAQMSVRFRLAAVPPVDKLVALEELLLCVEWWKSADTIESIY